MSEWPTSLVLIVDDEPSSIEVTRLLLEWHGYKVITATSGQEAIQQARRHHPDAIIMDIMMPGMSGYEAVQLIRQDQKIHEIPIVALTAAALKRDALEKARQAGFDIYLTKPIESVDLLLRSIRELIRPLSDTTD